MLFRSRVEEVGETAGESTGVREAEERGATGDTTEGGEAGVSSEGKTGKWKDRGTEGEDDTVEEGEA